MYRVRFRLDEKSPWQNTWFGLDEDRAIRELETQQARHGAENAIVEERVGDPWKFYAN